TRGSFESPARPRRDTGVARPRRRLEGARSGRANRPASRSGQGNGAGREGGAWGASQEARSVIQQVAETTRALCHVGQTGCSTFFGKRHDGVTIPIKSAWPEGGGSGATPNLRGRFGVRGAVWPPPPHVLPWENHDDPSACATDRRVPCRHR